MNSSLKIACLMMNEAGYFVDFYFSIQFKF